MFESPGYGNYSAVPQMHEKGPVAIHQVYEQADDKAKVVLLDRHKIVRRWGSQTAEEPCRRRHILFPSIAHLPSGNKHFGCFVPPGDAFCRSGNLLTLPFLTYLQKYSQSPGEIYHRRSLLTLPANFGFDGA
jgi:hypothetical protein